ncbi:MAG: tyrosine-type recombinase/integrase [Methylobacillus sp.]|jgi:integrase|nr:tyrosine-type recombinase/integrase [Methylobacillus sp.]
MGRLPTKNLNLPPHMRARQQKSGKVYYYYDLGGKPRKELPLGSDYIEAVRKWAELEESSLAPVNNLLTLKSVSDRYLRDVLPRKAARTQKDNLLELGNLLLFFGADFPIDAIEPLHVRQFLDHRKASPVRANREKALLSHIFNMAREWGITSKANPCAGVKGHTETGRTVYIEDGIFNAVYECACQPIQDAMDIAYLTGQRFSDTLKMSETDLRDGFLLVDQGKTGKRLRIEVSGMLSTVIARIKARKESYKVHTLRLICNEHGAPIRLQALQVRFQKARAKAIEKYPKLKDDIGNFQFRDLRAKAGTDKLESTENIVEAQRLLGHSTVQMTEHYVRDRRGDFVTPTK